MIPDITQPPGIFIIVQAASPKEARSHLSRDLTGGMLPLLLPSITPLPRCETISVVPQGISSAHAVATLAIPVLILPSSSLLRPSFSNHQLTCKPYKLTKFLAIPSEMIFMPIFSPPFLPKPTSGNPGEETLPSLTKFPPHSLPPTWFARSPRKLWRSNLLPSLYSPGPPCQG